MADAVVVGAGHNGLVAANLLADAGWQVQVLEATAQPGGSVRTAELTAPGFRSDVFSAFYALGAASPILRRLELEQYGLEWVHAPLVVAHPHADGRCAVLSRDLAETAASLEAFAPGDGAAWERLYGRWRRIRGPVLQGLFSLFPPVRAALGLPTRLPPRELLRLARFALLPVRRLAEEEFAGAGGGLLLGGNALHADVGPEAPGSGFLGFLLCSLGQELGYPAVRGGASQLTAALVRRLESRGDREPGRAANRAPCGVATHRWRRPGWRGTHATAPAGRRPRCRPARPGRAPARPRWRRRRQQHRPRTGCRHRRAGSAGGDAAAAR
jgi:phytoene dehydrogenase-like protein